MADTTGFVQKLSILPGPGWCCAWIGPSPTNTAILFVIRRSSDSAQVGQVKTAMMGALVSANAARREVTASHATGDSEITSVAVGP